MFGSLFYNFWGALFSFAVYFIWAIRDPYAMPWPTIGIAAVAAIIGFIAMFAVRYFVGYIFYTPEDVVHNETEIINDGTFVEEDGNQQFIPQNNRTTVEFEEENTEEIAQVVPSMLHGEEVVSR